MLEIISKVSYYATYGLSVDLLIFFGHSEALSIGGSICLKINIVEQYIESLNISRALFSLKNYIKNVFHIRNILKHHIQLKNSTFQRFMISNYVQNYIQAFIHTWELCRDQQKYFVIINSQFL